MAIRGSSLAGAVIPVGGPAGLPGQGTYQAWLALGNTGSLADFMAAQKGADGVVRSILGLSKSVITGDDILADEADAEAGTATTGLMTPDLTRRHVAASIAAAGAGTIGGALLSKLDADGDASDATVQVVGSPAVRKNSDRANDFVMLADELDSSRTFVQSLAQAKDRLKVKQGGRIRYPRGGFDLGTQIYTETDASILHEGEASTLLYSSNPSTPLFTFGSTGTNTNRSGLANIQVAATVARTGPLVRIANCYEPILDHVEAIASSTCDVAFDIDGGSNSYNSRLKTVRTFGNFTNAVRVGATARVQGFYLTDGWEFGGTTGPAILLLDVSGMVLGQGEALACQRGLQIYPGAGQLVAALQIGSGVLFDTCQLEGMYIADNGGYVERITSSGLWCCSNGGNNSGSTKYANVQIVASAFGHISHIEFLGAIFGNASNHGVVLLNVDGVGFIACEVDGNGAGGPGSGYFIGNGSKNVKIIGGSARGAFSVRSPFTACQQYAALIDAQTDYISILDRLDATGNVTGTIASYSSGSNNSLVSGAGFYG